MELRGKLKFNYGVSCMIELKSFFKLGNLSVIVDIWSRKKGKFVNTPAVFDTGASITHIHTGVLKNLGYDVDNAEKSCVSTIGSRSIRINNTVIDNINLDTLESRHSNFATIYTQSQSKQQKAR